MICNIACLAMDSNVLKASNTFNILIDISSNMAQHMRTLSDVVCTLFLRIQNTNSEDMWWHWGGKKIVYSIETVLQMFWFQQFFKIIECNLLFFQATYYMILCPYWKRHFDIQMWYSLRHGGPDCLWYHI